MKFNVKNAEALQSLCADTIHGQNKLCGRTPRTNEILYREFYDVTYA